MARSRTALLWLAAITALLGCCVSAPQGSAQGGVQGGAQVPPGVPHSTAPPAGVGGIQQRIYQGERISRLENAWRPHAHQFTVAQSTAARHTETARECGGVHSAGAADRFYNGGGGVLAVGQLLVARAGGYTGGRLTRDGGRLHARVAPALRGRPRHGGLPVTRAAAAAAAARSRAAERRLAPLHRRRRRLPQPSGPAAPVLIRLSHVFLPSA